MSWSSHAGLGLSVTLGLVLSPPRHNPAEGTGCFLNTVGMLLELGNSRSHGLCLHKGPLHPTSPGKNFQRLLGPPTTPHSTEAPMITAQGN